MSETKPHGILSKESASLDWQLRQLQHQARELQSRANELAKDFGQRLGFAWAKALLLLDLWEPELLNKARVVIDDLCKFLDELIRVASRRNPLLEALIALETQPELKEGIKELWQELGEPPALGQAYPRETLWAARHAICDLVAKAACVARPEVKSSLGQLQSALKDAGFQLEWRSEHLPAERQLPEKWEFKCTSADSSLSVTCISVGLGEIRTSGIAQAPAGPHLRGLYVFVSGPENVVNSLNGISPLIKGEGLISKLPAQIWKNWWQEASCLARRCISGTPQADDKKKALELLNTCLQLVNDSLSNGGKGSPRTPAGGTAPGSSPTGARYPTIGDDTILGYGEDRPQQVGQQFSRPLGSTGLGTSGEEARSSSGIAMLGYAAKLLRVWWKFCRDVLNLNLFPEPIVHTTSAGEIMIGFQGSLPWVDLHFQGADRRGLKFSTEDGLLTVWVSRDPSRSGPKILQGRGFWSWHGNSPSRCEWELSTGDCPDELWKIAQLGPISALPSPPPPRLAAILDEWYRKCCHLLSEADERSEKLKNLCQDVRGKLLQPPFSSELEQWYNEAMKSGASGGISSGMAGWLRALTAYLGISFFPPGGPPGNQVDPSRIDLNHSSIEFEFANSPRGEVLKVDRYALDPRRGKLTISLGKETEAPRSLRYAWYAWQLALQATDLNSLARKTEEIFRKEAASYLTDQPFSASAVKEDLVQVLEEFVRLSQTEGPDFVSRADRILQCIRHWAKHYGFTVLPEEYKPGAEFSELSSVSWECCTFMFSDSEPFRSVKFERLGWRHDRLGEVPPRLLVSAGPAPEGYKVVRQRLEQWNSPDPEVRKVLLEELEAWPRIITEKAKFDPVKEGVLQKDCIGELYRRVTEILRGKEREVRKALWDWITHQLWEEIFPQFQLSLWEPRSFDEARSGAFCKKWEPPEEGANDFEVIFPGVAWREKIFLAATVRLVRR